MYAKIGLILICAMIFSGCNPAPKPPVEKVKKTPANRQNVEKKVSVIVEVEATPEDLSIILEMLKFKGFVYDRQILEGKIPGKYYLCGEVEESKMPSLRKISGVVEVWPDSGVGIPEDKK